MRFTRYLIGLLLAAWLASPALAHGQGNGYSADLLAGLGHEGDTFLGAGLVYDLDDCKAIVGRVLRRNADDGFDWIGQVGFERHWLPKSEWNPYYGAGVGMVKEHRDPEVRTILVQGGESFTAWGPDHVPPPPMVILIERDTDHDYLTAHAGAGFAYRAGGVLSWVGDARLVVPLADDGETEIQATAGARWDL